MAITSKALRKIKSAETKRREREKENNTSVKIKTLGYFMQRATTTSNSITEHRRFCLTCKYCIGNKKFERSEEQKIIIVMNGTFEESRKSIKISSRFTSSFLDLKS